MKFLRLTRQLSSLLNITHDYNRMIGGGRNNFARLKNTFELTTWPWHALPDPASDAAPRSSLSIRRSLPSPTSECLPPHFESHSLQSFSPPQSLHGYIDFTSMSTLSPQSSAAASHKKTSSAPRRGFSHTSPRTPADSSASSSRAFHKQSHRAKRSGTSGFVGDHTPEQSPAYTTQADSSPSDDDYSSFDEDKGKSTLRAKRPAARGSSRRDDETAAWVASIPRSGGHTNGYSSPAADQFQWDEEDDYNRTIRISAASTLTQFETPPQTPRDSESFPRSFHDILVAAPISGVETMDALVDGMNGFGTDDFMSNRSTSKVGKLAYHPLYQPPLPTPPPGVVLGGGKPRKSGKSSKASSRSQRRSYSADEDDTHHPPYADESSPRPATSRAGSTSTVTPDTVLADELVKFPASIPSMDEILDKHIQEVKPRTVVPSISDIIRKHAPASSNMRMKLSLSRTSSSHEPKSLDCSIVEEPEPSSATDDADLVSRSSVDSIAAEIQQTLLQPSLQHARSFPGNRTPVMSDPLLSPTSEGHREPSIYSSSAHSGGPPPPSPLDLDILPKSVNEPSQAIATYLRSTRLTTLLKLTRSPHASRDRPLTVSLSDLGSPTGHPLLVFLGLGCVRHIMGLYDEMAECLGIRLIAIDR
jgi:hypothetical protein